MFLFIVSLSLSLLSSNISWFILKSHVDFHHHHVLHIIVHVSFFINVVIFFPAADHHSSVLTTYMNALVMCDSNISRFTHSHLFFFSFFFSFWKAINFFFSFVLWYSIFLVLRLSVYAYKKIFLGVFFCVWKIRCFLLLLIKKVRTFTHS